MMMTHNERNEGQAPMFEPIGQMVTLNHFHGTAYVDSISTYDPFVAKTPCWDHSEPVDEMERRTR